MDISGLSESIWECMWILDYRKRERQRNNGKKDTIGKHFSLCLGFISLFKKTSRPFYILMP